MIKLNTVALQKHQIMLKLEEDNEIMKNQIQYVKNKIADIQKQTISKAQIEKDLIKQHLKMKEQQSKLNEIQCSLQQSTPILQLNQNEMKSKLLTSKNLKQKLTFQINKMEESIKDKQIKISELKKESEANDEKYEEMESMVQVYTRKKQDWQHKIASIQAQISKIEHQIEQVSIR